MHTLNEGSQKQDFWELQLELRDQKGLLEAQGRQMTQLTEVVAEQTRMLKQALGLQ